MTEKGLEVIARNVQLAHDWINDLDCQLGWGDLHRSLRLLRVGLHALRDCLPIADAANFAAQLPLILRGLFYEQWRPTAAHIRMDREAFIERIAGDFAPDQLEDSADAIGAIFIVLEKKIGHGETAKLKHVLPHGVRDLWPKVKN